MTSKTFHCDVCNCDVSKKSQWKHLKSNKHLTNLNGAESEDDTDKRKCGSCCKLKGLNEFRDENITCNKCLDRWKRYKINHPEKVAHWQKTYIDKVKDEIYTCPICDCQVKMYKKTQHENGVGHKYLLELKERGEEMEQPDEITTDEDGKVWYECYTCRSCMLKNAWASHLIGSHHLKCKEAL